MRTFLLISVLTSVASRGAEVTAPTVRQKLQVKIMESIPAPALSKPATDQKETAAVPPPVLMKPVVVSDSKLIRAVTEAIDRAEQDRREERFSVLDGGEIYSIGRLRIGSWWSLDEGWTFLRLNKTPTHRQTEAAAARMKELQELANIGGKPKP
jgi:hypothetical protein